MATVPKPGRKTRLVADASEIFQARSDNLAKPPAGKLVDLNFKVSPDYHHQVKMEAVKRRMKVVDMLRAAFQEYWENHPSDE